MTADALSVNKEWNVKLTSTNDGAYAIKVISEFNEMYNNSIKVDNSFIEEYKKNITITRNNKLQSKSYPLQLDLIKCKKKH